jgi:Zn-dependent M16 (insulinase) family peptidase
MTAQGHRRRSFSDVGLTSFYRKIPRKSWPIALAFLVCMAYPARAGSFVLERTLSVPDSDGITAYLYVHELHKCPFLVVHAPNDTHNHVGVIVRTPTTDESGANHMLEHMVLIESEHYAGDDVFQDVTDRAFATYANAFTTSICTAFEYSTTNFKDLQNNLPVLLDLLFYSILTEENFLSECHRIEFVDNDRNEKLKHNGVVYNESEAQQLDRESFIFSALSKHLFPDSVQRFRFDGELESLEKVTIDDLRGLYGKYYRPSNMLWSHYGTFDPVYILTTVSNVIDSFPYQEITIDHSIYSQPKWSVPRTITIEGLLDDEADDPDERHTVLVAWYVCDLTDRERVSDFSFLSDLLMRPTHAILYQALVKSGLAKELYCDGMDRNSLLCSFTIGVDAVKAADVDRVISVIDETLASFEASQFDPAIKQATFNTFALDARVPRSNAGSQLFERLQPEWTFGMDPLSLVDVNAELEILRRHDESDPRYFENLVVEGLLKNPHRLTLIVKPRRGYVSDFNRTIAERLEATRQSLTEEEIARLVEAESGSEEEGEESEDEGEPVPQFLREDLTRVGDYTLPVSKSGDVALFVVPTRGTTTFRIFGQFAVAPADLLNFRILFSVLGRLGVGDRTDEEFSLCEDMYTDDFAFDLRDIETPDDPNCFPICEVITVKCLDKNCSETLALFDDLLFRPQFSNARAMEVVLDGLLHEELTACKEDPGYAIRHAEIGLSSVLNYTESLAGFYFVNALRQVVRAGDFEGLARELAPFFERTFRNATFLGGIHCSNADHGLAVLPLFETFVRRLNARGSEASQKVLTALSLPAQPHVFLELPVTSSMAAIAIPCGPFQDSALPIGFKVLAELLNSVFWRRLRGDQGAYGFSVTYQEFECAFAVATMCDPRPDLTEGVVRQVIEEIAKGEIEEEDVNNAVVRCFASMDFPESPHSRGWMPFCKGWTVEWMQARRDLVYGMTAQRLVTAAQYLMDRAWHCCIVSSKALMDLPEGFVLEAESESAIV